MEERKRAGSPARQVAMIEEKRSIISCIVIVFFAVLCVGVSSCAISVKTDPEASVETTTIESEDTAFPSEVQINPDASGSLERSKQIQKYLNSVEYNGAVLVQTENEVIFEGAYGFADHKNLSENQIGTVFEIGSITKQFTAVAIMMLAEQGKLSLDDTLASYIPDYPRADEITILNLLNMTSGIPDYITCGALGLSYHDIEEASPEMIDEITEIVGREYSREEIIRKISDYELLFEPGDDSFYSNTNYFFLGIILEKISGTTFFDFVETNFFVPLEMKNSSADSRDISSSGIFRIANGRVYLPHTDRSLSFSAGSICSDIRDLLLWENALMEGRFLSPSGWDSVFDPGAFNYGFGWRINGDYYYHGGQTAGYNTFVLIEPSSATVIIALSNIQGTDGYFSEGVVRSDQVGFEIYSIMQHSDTEKINENRGYEPDA